MNGKSEKEKKFAGIPENFVFPAEAGNWNVEYSTFVWVPAFAGMTRVFLHRNGLAASRRCHGSPNTKRSGTRRITSSDI